MGRKLAGGLAALALHTLATSASAQGYYPPQMYYPAHLYNPAYYPTPTAVAPRPPVTPAVGDLPPPGLLPGLQRLLTPTSAQSATAAPVAPPPAGPAPTPPAVLPSAEPPAAAPPHCGAPLMAIDPAPAGRPWHVFGMGGIALLRANLPTRQAFSTVTASSALNGAAVNDAAAITTTNFDPGLQIVPLASLGVVSSSGVGVRGRFFHYEEDASRGTLNADATGAARAVVSAQPSPFDIVSSASFGGVLPDGTGGGALEAGAGVDTILATHRFRATVWDLEVFQTGEVGCWTLLGGAGIRYAELQLQYGLTRVNPGGPDLTGTVLFLADRESSTARHSFDGIGPTVVAEASRQIGETGLSVYGLGRGSLLVGRHRLASAVSRQLSVTAFGAEFQNTDTLIGSDAVTRVLPVGELEVGTEYTRQFGDVRLLLRAGFNVQTWFDAGSAFGTQGNIDFVGGNFLVGLLY